jgi:hypothetical protein
VAPQILASVLVLGQVFLFFKGFAVPQGKKPFKKSARFKKTLAGMNTPKNK